MALGVFPNEKVERWAALATVLLTLLLFGVGASRLIYPFDVGHFEACTWTPALFAAQGKNPYDIALREPFATAPYGYFYYLAVGVGLRVFGWQFWFGRALTILAAGVCVYCLGRIVWALTKNRQAVLLSAMIFLATITLHHWLGVHRPDLPALALAFAALAIVFAFNGEGEFRLPIVTVVIVLLASAFFFKQTTLLPIAVSTARFWQMGRRNPALSVLFATILLIAIIGLALNATSNGAYFWQHFTLAERVPHSYGMAGHWLLSLFKSATTWIVAGLFVAALFAGNNHTGRFSGDKFNAWLKSPVCLWSCYLVAALGFAFVTSARAGAYINYYLEVSIVAAVVAGTAWRRLAEYGRWQKFYPALVLLILLAGAFEFSRMARAESYRWRSLPYYRELVTTLKNDTLPDGLCISVHPELAVAAGRSFHFGDWIQYHDGRSPELRQAFANAVISGRYAAIVWLKPGDPALPGYKVVSMQTPLPDRHYPVYLLLPATVTNR
ncbi:MAG: hypothetical protein KA368_09925 [Acidobacteria bacterium]|nr:hypothetical protein [Acidobacteriota bacterium]